MEGYKPFTAKHRLVEHLNSLEKAFTLDKLQKMSCWWKCFHSKWSFF